MLAPGKNYVGAPVRLTISLTDQTGTHEDPAALALKIISPKTRLTWGSYTFGSGDGVIVQDDTGYYYADISPDWPGQWSYRWEASDVSGNLTLVDEGKFYTQTSAFYDYDSDYSYDGYRWWSW